MQQLYVIAVKYLNLQSRPLCGAIKEQAKYQQTVYRNYFFNLEVWAYIIITQNKDIGTYFCWGEGLVCSDSNSSPHYPPYTIG